MIDIQPQKRQKTKLTQITCGFPQFKHLCFWTKDIKKKYGL